MSFRQARRSPAARALWTHIGSETAAPALPFSPGQVLSDIPTPLRRPLLFFAYIKQESGNAL